MGYTTEEANKLNMDHARNAMHKFNYFFVSLTFSVLALAINHGVETELKAQLIAGLLGWLLLLISGFTGLLLISEEGNYFRASAKFNEFEILKKDAESKKQAKGSTDAAVMAEHYAGEIKKGESWFKKADLKTNWQFKIQKWCFFFGVLCLVISYAYPLICAIFQKAPIVETALKSLQ